LAFTWLNPEGDNAQRARLMIEGWNEANEHILTGAGLYYRSKGTSGNFTDLWSIHITESGVLDLAIAFGWMATIVGFLGYFLVLIARRGSVSWQSALVAVIGGELAYGSPLNGFLGATVFFGCLLFMIFDEGGVDFQHIRGDRSSPKPSN
jgi:hypothetical protein